MTLNESIFNNLTSHSIFTLSYIKSLQRRYSQIILRHNPALLSLLASHLATVKTKNFRSKEWVDFTKKLKALRFDMISEWKSELMKEASEFRRKELWFVLGLFDELCPVMHKWITPELDSITAESILGQTIAQRIATVENSDVTRILIKTKRMFGSGFKVPEIVNSVVGTKINNYSGSSVGQTMNQTRANTATVISGLASSVLNGFSKSNNDVVGYDVFVAILDSHTTELCASHDGDTYEIGKGLYPPLHENCRSRRYPFIDGVALVNGRIFYLKDGESYIKRSFVEDAKTKTPNWSTMSSSERQAVVDSLRDSWVRRNIGISASNYTYETFLKGQPQSFQEYVLGKTKAKLFRDGGLTLKQFIDPAGRELTIKELYSRYSNSFTRANIKIGA